MEDLLDLSLLSWLVGALLAGVVAGAAAWWWFFYGSQMFVKREVDKITDDGWKATGDLDLRVTGSTHYGPDEECPMLVLAVDQRVETSEFGVEHVAHRRRMATKIEGNGLIRFHNAEQARLRELAKQAPVTEQK